MSNNTTTKQSGGIGFFGLLTVLFIGLKLTGYIAWSWWWVLAPLWLPIVILVVGILVIAIIAGFATKTKAVKKKKALDAAINRNKMN